MDRHAATRRLRRLAATAGIQVSRAHPHMLRHAFVTTMLASFPVAEGDRRGSRLTSSASAWHGLLGDESG